MLRCKSSSASECGVVNLNRAGNSIWSLHRPGCVVRRQLALKSNNPPESACVLYSLRNASDLPF